MIIGALFIIIQFGYYPWAPEFWVPNPHGHPRLIPPKSKVLNFMGTQPNPYQNFDSGSGITLWYPNFG